MCVRFDPVLGAKDHIAQFAGFSESVQRLEGFGEQGGVVDEQAFVAIFLAATHAFYAMVYGPHHYAECLP